jgi:phosphoribosylanthranilate isomerase
VGLDVIQLHGDETPETLLHVGKRCSRPVWRAIRMRSQDDLIHSARSFDTAECLLLDSFSEGFGGSGKTFDWSWIPSDFPARLILSGGLDASRVAQAIQVVRPFAVDVSSGIQGETPRHKDRRLMESFVAQVLQADASLAAQSGTA